MPTGVLATKLFAPARRSQLVARPRLIEQLDTTLDVNNRLTLVSAPAGFGKTTLLSDWLTHLESRSTDIRTCWLSLDEDDNDLSRLLAHLTASFQGAGIALDAAQLDSHHGTSPATAVTAIVNEVVRATGESPATHWVLVLDDVHVIGASEVHDALRFLLEHLPQRLHVLMATRSDPPLALARLRGRGELTEVRAGDLRFTQPESLLFLNRSMGLDLSASDADALDKRTEGWIAGLQLAALSLRGIREPEAVAVFIEAFTGSNRFVIDYLADEVLARQSTDVRAFLLRTAILDRLAPDLCDAVTAGADGRVILEDLERANLFVVPLDHERAWYRYHHLFADVLRARLLAEHKDEVPELHRRASAWYAAHDLPVRAVRHAVSAEDFGLAARLMEEALPAMRRARQDSVLLTWMQSLPESVIRRSPVLSTVTAWSHLMSGELDSVEHWLEAAEAALDAGAQDAEMASSWADTEDLRTAPATISVYRASLAQALGDVAGTVRHAHEALELAGPEDHIIRGAGGGFLGLAAFAAGNVSEALETFGSAVRSLHAAGNLVDELDATIVLADMWVALGRHGKARQLYDRTLQRATGSGEPFPRATADLHVGLADLDRERDDLTSAEAHLEAARILGQRASITENRFRWYVVRAHIFAATGDYDAAVDLLDQAESLYRPGFYPEIRPIPAIRARVQIASGDLGAAASWAHERDLDVDNDPAYLAEYEYLTLVRLLLAQHRVGPRTDDVDRASPADAALDLLLRCHAAAAEAGRDGSVVEIRMLQALAHHARGDLPQAVAALERAFLDSPEPDSYTRLYLDEGTPMTDLLERAVSEWDVSVPDRLRRPGKGEATGALAPSALVDPLSDRELEVLHLLDSDLTGPEIARQLYVSVNTLRTHTKRIFTKLDANTRAAAVRRAHQLGLL